LKSLLDQTVFQRMVRNQTDPAPGRQEADKAFQELTQLVKLIVNQDAEGLESAGRRMQALFPPTGRDGPQDGVHQILGIFQGAQPAGGNDFPGDPAGTALLSIFKQTVGQGALIQVIQPIQGGVALALIQAHIQRIRPLETESPAGGRQLIGGKPQVQ
jgi:hypothetical protein